jgi:LmbE family N-acetylglucosaminyl deacetylase
MKRIMAVGAHPDDIEFGCSGTLLKHKRQGDEIVMVIMTDSQSISGVTGEQLRSKRELKQESKEAANIIGCKLEFLPFIDLKVPFGFESISKLETLILKYKIDTIYTHWGGDTNQDHEATLKTTMAAARLLPNVLCYEQIPIPRITNVYPTANYYIDITEQFEQKIRACKCHDSQLKKYKEQGFDILSGLEALARYRGNQIGVKYAEAFDILKMVDNL